MASHDDGNGSLRPPVSRSNDLTGFTLAEVLMVVVIVGILASMGIPNYRRTIERSYWREAQDILMTIYAGERVYFFANNAYYDVNEGAADPMAEWRTIHVENPNLGSIPVSFAVTFAGPAAFTARAQRNVGVFMTINENRDVNMASWPMP